MHTRAHARTCTHAGGSIRLVENLILVNARLPDPDAAGPAAAMRPLGLAPPGGHLTLRDVRILVDRATMLQHARFFNPGARNETAVPNTTFVYTDRASFVHVNSWFNEHTTWQSVGLLVADGLDDALATTASTALFGGARRRLLQLPGRPGAPHNATAAISKAVAGTMVAAAAAGRGEGGPRNYVLAVDPSTVVPQMIARCGVPTLAPLLIYVTTNLTLTKPPVPKVRLDVSRCDEWTR